MPPSIPCTREYALRLSVTDRCNFRCGYCRPEARAPRSHERPLDTGELVELVAWLGRTVPLRKIRITGGEPLLRPGIPELVARLHDGTGVRDLSMTTNGSRLASLARPLSRSGLRRVNVSLDTLDPHRFRQRTGGELDDTLRGIEAALAADLRPVKLNVVLHRSSWREEVPALLDFAAELAVEVRFIELMRTGTAARWIADEFVAAGEAKAWLRDRTTLVDGTHPGAAPARPSTVRWRSRSVPVGWIRPETAPFCADCDRLRLDARGRLRRCLMDPRPLSVRALATLADQDVARTRVAEYLRAKTPPRTMGTDTPMAAIGG